MTKAAEKKNTGKRSLSRPVAKSATASEILELGKRLVAELDGEETRDLLLRWMSHRIAELIAVADGSVGDDREPHVQAAAEAILELWDYRSTLRTIDPLADLGPILKVMRSLDSDNNPWWPRPPHGTDAAISDVYSGFRNLIVSFLLQSNGVSAVAPTNPLFLSADEIEIRETLGNWLTDYQRRMLGQEAPRPERKKPKKATESVEHDPKAYLISQIRDARDALDDLERAVEGKPPMKRVGNYEKYLKGVLGDLEM